MYYRLMAWPQMVALPNIWGLVMIVALFTSLGSKF